MRRTEVIANGIGLSVLAAEVIVGLSVVSHLICPRCDYPDETLRWYGRTIAFLVCYSALSFAAIYLWQRNLFIRTTAHWLGFIAVCGLLAWIDPVRWRGWIRGGGIMGIVIGIASLARSLAMRRGWHEAEPSHSHPLS